MNITFYVEWSCQVFEYLITRIRHFARVLPKVWKIAWKTARHVYRSSVRLTLFKNFLIARSTAIKFFRNRKFSKIFTKRQFF